MSDPSVTLLGVTVAGGVAILVVYNLWNRTYGTRFEIGSQKKIRTWGSSSPEKAVENAEKMIEVLTDVPEKEVKDET